MLIHTQNTFFNFHCLAGDCPHTCCEGWAVPIDSRTAQFYNSLPGEFGERIRSVMTEDGEGGMCFPLQGGRCPFLNKDNLCDIHLELDKNVTSEVCRTHPRFFYDFGCIKEMGLCGSCPEAVRLIFESDFKILEERTPQPVKDAPPLLVPFIISRNEAFNLLAVGNATTGNRLQALLLFANDMQVLIDEERADAVTELCQVYADNFPLLNISTLPDRTESFSACLTEIEGLTILSPAWRELLQKGREYLEQKPLFTPMFPTTVRRMGQYFIYRHWLRGVWDGDLLSWAELTVLGIVLCAFLSPMCDEGYREVFRLFCQEIEHSQDNLNALQTAFRERLSLAQLLSIANL